MTRIRRRDATPSGLPPASPSRLAWWCLRTVTSRARADAILGDIAEDVQAGAGAGQRDPGWSRTRIEARVWQHVAAEALSLLPPLARAGRFLVRDVRRSLGAAPGTSAFIVILLALGIAAATTVFSVVDTVVLRPLPYPAPDRLVAIDVRSDSFPLGTSSPLGLFERLAERADAFSDLAGSRRQFNEALALPGTAAEPLQSVLVTGTLFDVVGVPPLLGRTVSTADTTPGRGSVAVLSYELWQDRFGGDPAIVSRSIPLRTGPVTVIGVMPKGFRYPIADDARPALWRPLVVTAQDRSMPESAPYLSLVARLAPGATIARGQAQADAALRSLAADGAPGLSDLRAFVAPLGRALVADVRGWMLLLLGAVTLVMLVACANVANVLLARASRRARELAVRASMGASRRYLTASVLAESLTLSVAAALLGLLGAWQGIEVVRGALPGGIARASGIALDARVLAVAAMAAIGTGLVFGAVPAWQAARQDLVPLLKDQSARTTAGRRGWRAAFLVAEVAFVSLLLVSTTLFVTSFIRVTTADLGFDRRHLAVVEADGLSGSVTAVLDSLTSAPGVVAATAFDYGSGPLLWATRSGGASGTRLETMDGAKTADTLFLGVAPGYFDTYGIPLLRGRDFRREELGRSGPVILSASTARQLFGDADPVGSALRGRNHDLTVVGVAADVRDRGPEKAPSPMMYMPAEPDAGQAILVRTASDPAGAASAIQAALRPFRPADDRPVELRPLADAFNVITTARRFAAELMGAFGVMALLIGAAGIYGVMTSVVVQQRREFGIRAALGARSSTIVTSVLARAWRQVVAGLAIGLPTAFLVARGSAAVFFGVTPADAYVYAIAGGLILVAGLTAAWFPARRAGRANPIEVLRAD